MSPFVEECRREWERLGVPDLLADEMAAELEADLAEAEADGISAAEMTGESDPRRFAATWADERGLVSEPAPQKRRRRVWPWVLLFVFIVLFLSWLALQTLGTSHASSAPPVQVTPVQRVSVPNVVGMDGCKAVRIVASSAADGWRVAGHRHGFSCKERLIVVAQSPVGHVVRRDDHKVIVTLRLGRAKR